MNSARWTAAVMAVGLLACQRGVAGERYGATAHITGPAGSLHVDDGGTGGTPVLFVHSFAGNTAHWSNQLAHLRDQRRAIAFDLRGHGKSAAPAQAAAYAVDSLAADIGAVADSLGLDRFVLVGHSMGGSAALAYSAQHPDRVAGLVLVGTPGKTPPQQARQVLASLDKDYAKTMQMYWDRLLTDARPDVLSRIEAERKAVRQDAAVAQIRALFAYDPTAALRSYSGPTLIVDTPQGEGPGALHTLAPDAPRKVVRETSHWVQLDKPEEMNRILDEFLAQVDQGVATKRQ
jgi:pimeloyl-ACP methyl ester carboxylesterase